VIRAALITLVTTAAVPALAEPADAVKVGPTSYTPAFPVSPADRDRTVPAFWIDREPVTNAQYAAFVAATPSWRRDRVKPLFADARYLSHWRSTDELGERARPDAPVVQVSWFAARAFCADRGGRLPTEAEWEVVAAASPTERDASHDPAWSAQILAWYGEPTPAVIPAITHRANAWGVADLHGLVWEWVEDFGSSLVGAEAGSLCGAEAAAAKDPRAYATFMRFAFRGSLAARFTTPNLGFRCAYDEVQR